LAKSKTRKKRPKSGKSGNEVSRFLRDNAVSRYLRETRAEMRKVHWPTREEAWNLTKIVFAVTVSMALLLGLLDYLFALELKGMIASSAVAIGIAVLALVLSVLAAVILSRRTAR
jgi:preprotein translocase subunit SecE